MGSAAALPLIGYFHSAFQAFRPSNSADLAAWVGAIGTIVAIIVAWMGIRAQLRHAETLALDAAKVAKKDVVIALVAELKVYKTAITDISEQIARSPSSIFAQMLQIIFPSNTLRFPVYLASAAHISAIADVELRSRVIGLYAEMDMFFALLDKNSSVAMRIQHGERPSNDVQSELQSLHPLITEKIDHLLRHINRAISELSLECQRGQISIH